ncbi:putative uncharacterized protein C2orf48 isoform X3 [Symphalangus syndactylus]|uniref:putative uncharacterized protein C2orf48 isoform X3 n=1 Tax=Symphalangus syndactylus TaxID=9590 RepID=UPI0030063393
MESRPSRRQHASEGDGDQSPTQCAGMRSSGRSDQPYVLRGKPLPLRVRCYSGCASGSRRQSQLSAIINTEDFSDRMCGGSSGRKPGRRFLWPSRHQDMGRRWPSPTQEEALLDTGPWLHLDLGLLVPRTVRSRFLLITLPICGLS